MCSVVCNDKQGKYVSWYENSQPGGVTHPPNPEGVKHSGRRWALEVLPNLAKGSRTRKDLEWFGPLERNTLRPLCDVLLDSLRDQGGRKSGESPESLQCLLLWACSPFYIPRERHLQGCWVPTGGPSGEMEQCSTSFLFTTVDGDLILDLCLACVGVQTGIDPLPVAPHLVGTAPVR